MGGSADGEAEAQRYEVPDRTAMIRSLHGRTHVASRQVVLLRHVVSSDDVFHHFEGSLSPPLQERRVQLHLSFVFTAFTASLRFQHMCSVPFPEDTLVMSTCASTFDGVMRSMCFHARGICWDPVGLVYPVACTGFVHPNRLTCRRGLEHQTKSTRPFAQSTKSTICSVQLAEGQTK